MSDEPICVRRTNTIEEAEVLVAWLDEQGVKAHVIDPENPGVFAFGVTDVEGIAVYVRDEAAAAKATVLLETHDRIREQNETDAGKINTKCEECGCSATFPADTAGTVQQCPDCNAYIDVPSPAKGD